jgi:hypothetical protein
VRWHWKDLAPSAVHTQGPEDEGVTGVESDNWLDGD